MLEEEKMEPRLRSLAEQNTDMDMEFSEGSNVELFTALSKAQGEIQEAIKDRENPHLKSSYADLASIWRACREPLSKNGLSVIQIPVAKGMNAGCITQLSHISGQWVRGKLVMISKSPAPQDIGSVTTYAKKYSLAAFVGVAAAEDDTDDDGEAGQNGYYGRDKNAGGKAADGKDTPLCEGCQKPIDRFTSSDGQIFTIPEVLSASSRDWDGHLFCGDCQVAKRKRRNEARRAAQAPPAPAAQPPLTPRHYADEPGPALVLAPPENPDAEPDDAEPAPVDDPYYAPVGEDLLVSGTVVSVTKPKATASGTGETVAVTMLDKSVLGCFHKTMHPFLANAKGQRCVFVYTISGKYKNIAEIRRIGRLEFDKGVPVIQQSDR